MSDELPQVPDDASGAEGPGPRIRPLKIDLQRRRKTMFYLSRLIVAQFEAVMELAAQSVRSMPPDELIGSGGVELHAVIDFGNQVVRMTATPPTNTGDEWAILLEGGPQAPPGMAWDGDWYMTKGDNTW